MAKRRAENPLSRSFEEEEDSSEPEPTGVFERAPDDVLAKRTIRKAKRTITSNDGAAKPSPFAGFSFFENGGPTPTLNTTAVTSSAATPSSNGNRTSDEYLSKVAKLNRDILKCMSRLMDNDAYLNLTPCFEDYIAHFQRLTREEDDRRCKNNSRNNAVTPASTTDPVSSSEAATSKASTDPPKQTFTFGAPTANKTSMFGGNSPSSTFNFDSASKSAASEANSKPAFQFTKPAEPSAKFRFGLPSTALNVDKASDSTSKASDSQSSLFGEVKPWTSTFSAGEKKPFSFGSPPASAFGQGFSKSSNLASATSAENDDDEDQPPKVDIVPVEEAGSLYTKKVKLFYRKKEGPYAEKGVGFLHIIPLNGGGHQLLVRAQTTLGNVLLNIRIGKDLPVNRVGKNNVAIMCVPNPPLNPKSNDQSPTMFLIRVKNPEDADELRDKLVEFKGAV